VKVLSAIDRGIPRREVAELFGVSLSTIERWLERRCQTGDINTYEIPGRPSVTGAALRQWLPQQLKANPELTDHAARLRSRPDAGDYPEPANAERSRAHPPGVGFSREPRPFHLPLFTGVRGIGILGSSNPAFCIAPPG
jgi:transcriptional regulator with XRE-family HTH domain